jgi:hypothetical protein
MAKAIHDELELHALADCEVDSGIPCNSDIDNGDDLVYKRNKALWSEFVMGIAHLAALKPVVTFDNTEAQSNSIECFNIQKKVGVEKIDSTKTL